MDLFNGHAFLGASVRLPLAMSTSRLCSHEQALASLYGVDAESESGHLDKRKNSMLWLPESVYCACRRG